MKKYVISKKYEHLYDKENMTIEDYGNIGRIILKDKLEKIKRWFKRNKQ